MKKIGSALRRNLDLSRDELLRCIVDARELARRFKSEAERLSEEATALDLRISRCAESYERHQASWNSYLMREGTRK